MKVIIHKELEVLEELVPVLEDLINNYHEVTIFHDVVWMKNWWRHKNRMEEITPYIVEIKKGNDTVGIIPMYLSNKEFANRQFHILKPVGTGVFNYFTPILSKDYCPQKLLRKAFDKIYEDKHNWDSIHWDGLLEGSNLDLFLEKKRNKYVKRKKLVISPRVKLNKDLKVFHKQVSKSFLKSIFSNERKMKRDGELQYIVVEKEADITPIMDRFFEFHCDRWKFSPYRFSEERELLMNTVKSFFQRGLLHLSYLSYNSEIAAVELGIIDRKIRYMYMGVMNPVFHKYSVGHILMYKVIEDACIHGCKIADFFGGTEEYKQKWGPVNRNLLEFSLFNNSKKSFLYRQINETYYSKQFLQKPLLNQLIAKVFIRGCTLLLGVNDNSNKGMKSSTS